MPQAPEAQSASERAVSSVKGVLVLLPQQATLSLPGQQKGRSEIKVAASTIKLLFYLPKQDCHK